MPDRKPIFDAFRAYMGGSLNSKQVSEMDTFLDGQDQPRGASALTARAANFSICKEGMVLEAYKDGGGVWTAFGGVTNASGHEVYPRYKDKPQPIQYAVEITVWLMETTYLPAVLTAFAGYSLSESELAAALSFHWNTGAIQKTDWVKMVKAGDRAGAEAFLRSHYLNGGALQSRRDSEADLFFHAKWPASMMTPIYGVSKPSYSPAWGSAKSTDLMPYIEGALA